MKNEAVFEAAQHVRGSLEALPLDISFGRVMVEEMGDSVTRQLTSALVV